MSEVSLLDFKKIELKIAKIIDVAEVPGADKLWKLSIDVGSEKKEIVAGVKPYYSKEQLLGKCIVIVNNLTPATIRGFESKGMLLAAKDGSNLALLTLDRDLPAGSLVS